jgi:hypothetical protein
MNREQTLNRLIEFIRTEVPPPLLTTLSASTDLRKDLRMAEEDADEILCKLFQVFAIQRGDFNFTRYFPSEGLCFFGRQPKAVPLTIGMLLQAACAGVWNTQTIEAQ